MAYSRITRTKNGADALKYAEGIGHGHNGNEERNEFVSGVNLLAGVSYVQQMQRYWDKARSNHKTQVLRIVQSFSVKEFNPENLSDGSLANELGVEFAKTYYPNRQVVVFTQRDGKSGLWHNHVIVNDVEMETLKGCENYQYKHSVVKSWNDKITSKYTTLDKGKQQTADKISRAERVKREQSEYVWRDDLKSRVHAAMEITKTENDFVECLKANGVDATRKTSKKYGEYFTYQLLDTSNAPEGCKLPKRKLLGRSYKLGTAYGLDALRDVIKAKEPKEQPKPAKVEPVIVEVETEAEQAESPMDFHDWCKSNGETFYDEADEMDWDKYEALRERYDAFLSGGKASAEEMTDEVLEAPYEPFTLAELPDTDSNSKVDEVDVEDVKRKQEVKRQAVLCEKQNAEKKLKGSGRAVSSHLQDIWEQARADSDDREYQ